MRNKLFAAALAVFALFTAAPHSAAADIPLLTWERGKEQNIVLGGYTDQASWKIRLVNSANNALDLASSTPNKDGYVVYSIILPNDLPTGAYRIETLSKKGETNVVAGIQIIELAYFDILRVPIQLLILVSVLIFVLSTLSTLRIRRYEEMSYLQAKTEVSLSPAIASFYRLRRNAVSGVQRSLFKHVIKKEGELFHKISPALWSIFPIATFILGAYIGIAAGSTLGIPNIPIFLFLVAAMIGIFDPYSGFTAAIGFSILQTMQGNISTVRAVGALMAIALAWIAPGLLASIYREMLTKENLPIRLHKYLPLIISALVAGAVFYSSELLLLSLLDRIGPLVNTRIDLPIVVGITFLLKEQIQIMVERHSLLTPSNLEVKTIRLTRIISPRALIVLALFFAGVSYIWTESIWFAGLCSLFFVFPLLLLQVRFASPKIASLARIPRNILIESTLVTALSAGIFIYIQNSPFDAIQKGKLILLGATIPLALHAIYSSLSDIQEREMVDIS
jgi:hypothetical protein